MVSVNYSKLQVCDTEGMIDAEYEIEHGNIEVADSSLFIFTIVFHLHFFFSLINFLLFCFVCTFKELIEVHKSVCAVYGPNAANGLKKKKVLNLY